MTGVAPSGASMRNIPTAAKITNRRHVDITSLLLGRRLRHVVRLLGAAGFRSVLVDMDELVAVSRTGVGVEFDDVAKVAGHTPDLVATSSVRWRLTSARWSSGAAATP